MRTSHLCLSVLGCLDASKHQMPSRMSISPPVIREEKPCLRLPPPSDYLTGMAERAKELYVPLWLGIMTSEIGTGGWGCYHMVTWDMVVFTSSSERFCVYSRAASHYCSIQIKYISLGCLRIVVHVWMGMHMCMHTGGIRNALLPPSLLRSYYRYALLVRLWNYFKKSLIPFLCNKRDK